MTSGNSLGNVSMRETTSSRNATISMLLWIQQFSKLLKTRQLLVPRRAIQLCYSKLVLRDDGLGLKWTSTVPFRRTKWSCFWKKMRELTILKSSLQQAKVNSKPQSILKKFYLRWSMPELLLLVKMELTRLQISDGRRKIKRYGLVSL